MVQLIQRHKHRPVICSPNLHIEAAVAQTLSDVLSLVNDILDDEPTIATAATAAADDASPNNVMYYLAVKFSYPIDVVHHDQFQAVAVAFQYQGPNVDFRIPVGVYSFGTIRGSQATLARIVDCVNRLEPATTRFDPMNDPQHAEVIFGFDDTQALCEEAPATLPMYHIVVPGEAIISMDRSFTSGEDLSPILHNVDISLFEVS